MTVKMSSMLPVRDQTGAWLDLGAVRQVAEWRAWPEPATLPAWLVPDGGQTNTVRAAGSTAPGLILTGTDTASPARLRMNAGIARAPLAGIRIDVVGITHDVSGSAAGSVTVALTTSASKDAANGVTFTVPQTAGGRSTLAVGATTATLTHAPSPTVGPHRGRFSGLSLGLIVDWRAYQAWAVEGSDVVGVLDYAAAPVAPPQINPSFHFGPGAAGDALRIAAVRVTCWYD